MKALCVFSGGLDSMLAAALIRGQGIDVLALFFETPFFEAHKARKSAQSMDLPIQVVDISERHLAMVKNPKHGYGSHMNPCIDCHALMFRIAGEMLVEKNASFVVSGEVLGQRPMSQNKQALGAVATESGLGGLLLRPLSAKCLPLTLAEEKGWVNRESLMDFQGRTRKPQIELAAKWHITGYPSPAGGCLLTEKVFSSRLKDLFSSRPDAPVRDIRLLKVGRHFRIDERTKAIVGRNKKENESLLSLKETGEVLLTTTSVPGPTVLLAGDISKASIDFAVNLTVAYSDAEKHADAEVKLMGSGLSPVHPAEISDKAAFKAFMI